MADVRAWWEAPGWIDLGHTPTYVSSTQFTVTGNQTAIYEVGRRLRATDGIGGMVYGTITASSYSTTTSVTVDWDGTGIDNTVAQVAVGAAGIANPWASFSTLSGTLNLSQIPTLALVPAGVVVPFAGMTPPDGWLLCDGSAQSRTDYANLFTAISTTYGAGDGSTTFNLPDLRGRSVFGLDNMGGTTASRVTNGVSGITGTTLGAVGGSEAMHGHTHTASVTDPGHTHDANAVFGAASNNPSGAAVTRDTGTTGSRLVTKTATTGITVSNSSAGDGSSQNMPPAMMLNMMIKT
ncbi:MAG: tail fiber protein [Mesorhizobium sp.]|nr:tail fiber protein [Mesorhizobium sp.]